MKDYKSRLKEVFSEVLESSVYNEILVRKYFSQDYIQHVDGKTLHFDSFLQHMKALKQDGSELLIDIKTLVQEGNTVFSNHLVNVTTIENRKTQIQVIGEFRFQGDQICYCDELTHLISGDSKDKDLGSRV